MAEMTPKHAKRIRALIGSKWTAYVMLAAGFALMPLGPLLLLLSWAYGFEAKKFLRLYPKMHPQQVLALESTKNAYFLTATVHTILWALIGAVIAVIVILNN